MDLALKIILWFFIIVGSISVILSLVYPEIEIEHRQQKWTENPTRALGLKNIDRIFTILILATILIFWGYKG